MALDFMKVTENFDKSLREHEKEIVIDLAIDRFVKFVVTYILGTLAVATGIFLIAEPLTSCQAWHELNDNAEAVFTNSYCWHSTPSINPLCTDLTVSQNNTILLDSHDEIKSLYKWFPYFLITQIIIFLLPWAYWHYRVGSRLIGQLRYMEFFLKELHKLFADDINNVYNGMPYDEHSKVFNGYELYRLEKINDNWDESESDVENGRTLEYQNKKSIEQKVLKRNNDSSRSFVTGNLLDRHLFSRFCYENLASFRYLSNVLSVFEASRDYGEFRGGKPDNDYYAMKVAILYQWCHPKNFSNNILAYFYLLRQFCTCVLALINIGFMIGWYEMELKTSNQSEAQSFRCFLPHREKCVQCWINRKNEIFLFFWLDFAIIFVIFILTLFQWLQIRLSRQHAVSHYFEKILRTVN